MAESPLIPHPSAPAGAAVNPLALSIEETARMLSAAGGKRITPAQIQAFRSWLVEAGPAAE